MCEAQVMPANPQTTFYDEIVSIVLCHRLLTALSALTSGCAMCPARMSQEHHTDWRNNPKCQFRIEMSYVVSGEQHGLT